jgi:hypothetical protein
LKEFFGLLKDKIFNSIKPGNHSIKGGQLAADGWIILKWILKE